MVIALIIGLLLFAIAAVLGLRAAAFAELRVSSQVDRIESYGFTGDAPPSDLPEPGLLARLAEHLGRRAIERIPSVKPMERRELMAAGLYGFTTERFHGYRILAGVGLPALILALILLGSGSPSALTLLMIAAVAALGWLIPPAMVRTRGQRRLDRVDRDLPDLIDVLTATIEAGLGFGGSLQLVADRFEGPLGVELRLALQEQTMGLSTEAALSNLLDRCDTPSVRSFVRGVLQADSLGVSIGQVLRNLATETRKRRRALARERAQRAPVKLLFPLVFLIFPALLIVLMYPTVHNISQVLGV